LKEGVIADALMADSASLPYRSLWRDGIRVDDVFRVRLDRSPGLRLQMACKRGFDIAASLMLLVLTSPLIVVGALATMITSPGNPFFCGPRWGAADRLFRCFKLRTMHVDGAAILARHGLNDRGENGRLLVFERDPRITPVGTLLRETSIDELPQLWNVVRGDMSLVGPRPLSVYMLENFGELRTIRGAARPGITGLWQVRNRMKNASVLDMIDDDAEYLATWTFVADLRILFATLPQLLKPTSSSDDR
jgi:exopolysaccharide production protein ExoY